MNPELKVEINRLLYRARLAIDMAQKHGGEYARGWAKTTLDLIVSDLEERYPEEDWSG